MIKWHIHRWIWMAKAAEPGSSGVGYYCLCCKTWRDYKDKPLAVRLRDAWNHIPAVLNELLGRTAY